MLNVCQSIRKPSVPPIHLSARWLTRSHSSECAEWRSKLTVIPSPRSQSFEYESRRQSLSLSSLNILGAAAGARRTATPEPHFVPECIWGGDANTTPGVASEKVIPFHLNVFLWVAAETLGDPVVNSKCVILLITRALKPAVLLGPFKKIGQNQINDEAPHTHSEMMRESQVSKTPTALSRPSE